MSARLLARPPRRFLAFVTIALVAFGCNLVVGSYDYRDGVGPAPDVVTETAREAEPSCNVDLESVCYPCAPTTNEQFLNACGDSPCIPFDRSRLEKLLLPDGALPPLPSDGGT